MTKGVGAYGTDYMKRAVLAAFGWPANLQQDAVYPYIEVDSTGQPLSGANKYTLTFAQGREPPVNGFWSITMYEVDQAGWFVPNALPSARATTSRPTPTARSRSISRTSRRAQTRSPTGYRRRRAHSFRCCACTGPRRPIHQSWTERGRHRR